jgi:hypothetical protein
MIAREEPTAPYKRAPETPTSRLSAKPTSKVI